MSAVNVNRNPQATPISHRGPRKKIKEKANANRSTGPITAEGKLKSSGNSTTHGCTVKVDVGNGLLTSEQEARLILPDEIRADWDVLKQTWLEEYRPESLLRMDAVIRAAVADWHMRRNARRYNEAEQLLYLEQPNATLWSEKQHALLERFLRYQTKAERTFYRARTVLEQIRRELKRDAERVEASSALPSPQSPNGQPQTTAAESHPEPVPSGRESSLIQCITVQVLDGKTLSLFQPRSENLERIIATAAEPKPIVKRALYFLHGIPEEYAWVIPDEDHDGRPHLVITRSSEEALRDLERERLQGNGHVLEVS